MMSQRVSALIIAPPGRLRVLLRATGRIARVEQADDPRSGLQSIAQLSPGLVLLDAGLGEEDVWGRLRQIKTR